MEKSSGNVVIEFGRSVSAWIHVLFTFLYSSYLRGGFAGDHCPLFTIPTVSRSDVIHLILFTTASPGSEAIKSLSIENPMSGNLSLHILGLSASEIKGLAVAAPIPFD
jgi:hypothetical protein